MSTSVKRVYGYLAEFESASHLYKGAEQVRDAGFKKWDCYSSYPIHGLDDAMGVRRSILPYFVFFGGSTGLLTGFSLAFITQVLLYPTVVQAKPANIFTTAAFFPIMFELTILFGGILTVLALVGFAGLYPRKLDEHYSPRFSAEEFGVVVNCEDRDIAEVEALMRGHNAKEVTLNAGH